MSDLGSCAMFEFCGFLIGKGLGGQCKFSDFFELENLCYSVLNCLRLSLVVFSWGKDVGSVQVLRISLNSETFLNNPM
jgi:hypothetical protein